jgi:hypothetical protein
LGDAFGSSLAVADFNSDGKADLVIGVPNDIVKFSGVVTQAAGAIHILYGNANRLSALGTQYWTQESLGVVVEPYDRFGSSLAAGMSVRTGERTAAQLSASTRTLSSTANRSTGRISSSQVVGTAGKLAKSAPGFGQVLKSLTMTLADFVAWFKIR